MYHFRRNKSELIVLTGAIYSFVAYLTAFALEILFLIDLTRRSNEILSTLATTSTPAGNSINDGALSSTDQPADTSGPGSPLGDRLTFESLQAHITISSLTIAILYFIIFITSLVLIVALILRSTFMLLIWLCAMATMYLPEFGLVVYVSVYSWGLGTRNGQTELAFYLFRAALNLVFILRAHKLYKQWNYEKNFFRLKSGSAGGFSNNFSAPYDSPYFIGGPSLASGDSLTTTINPIFSSTLNLNRYDFVRDQFNHQNNQASSSSANDSRGTSPATQHSLYAVSSSEATSNHRHREHLARATSALYSRDPPAAKQFGKPNQRSSYDFDNNNLYASRHDGAKRYYLGEPSLSPSSREKSAAKPQQSKRQSSMLSINDQYADYELDLEYRTLDKSPARTHLDRAAIRDSPLARRHHQQPTNYNATPIRRVANTTGQRFEPHRDDFHQVNPSPMMSRQSIANMSRSVDDLAYSTQSLDRRNSRDFTLTEQVVLRPLGHQPFEYLHRPGSTTNLNYN